MGSPDYWARQLREPVLLDDAMATVLSAGCDTFLELGPGSSMIGGLRRHRTWNARHAAVALLGRAQDDADASLLRTMGWLWERGADVAAQRPASGADRPGLCSLPGHPYESADPRPDAAVAGAAAAQRPADARKRQDDGRLTRPALELLWCQALGVQSAVNSDDFFALGGESLMAVALISGVREQFGSDVSVADFTAAATFGQLTERVGAGPRRPAAAESSTASVVVTLRDAGDRAAVFLVADALGSATSYEVLAGHLDDHRVYGLEPSARHQAGRDCPPIAELAASHADAIVRAQPSGPYTIGGWSFGALVAHEVAAQLISRGEQVDLLICLDGVVPSARGLPVALNPAFLAMSLRLQLSAALGIGSIGAQVHRAPALRRRFIASIGALLRYRPRPVPCQMVLFEAGVSQADTAGTERRLAGIYAGGARVHPAGGDHWSMLAEPHARVLAGKLLDVLRERAARQEKAASP